MKRLAPILIALLAAAPAPASAQAYRVCDFHEIRGDLAISMTISDLFDPKAFRSLSSGMITTVRVRVLVTDKKTKRSLTLSRATFQAVYDLWNERYQIRTSTKKGVRVLTVKTKAEALRAMTNLTMLPIAELSLFQRGRLYSASVVAELNPVSEKEVAEIRQWIHRPASRSAETSTVFGAFVSIFVNADIAEADRVLRFRTQPFFRKKKPKAVKQ